MTNEARCNSCKWFDTKTGDCDHCAYGHPYINYNGLKPDEVENCEIYTKDEGKIYEWQWGIYNTMTNKWELTSYHSCPKDMNWVKFEVTKRRIRDKTMPRMR